MLYEKNADKAFPASSAFSFLLLKIYARYEINASIYFSASKIIIHPPYFLYASLNAVLS